MTSIACIVIATERRRAQVERDIVPNVWHQDFDDFVVVGDWAPASRRSIAYRYFCVEPIVREPRVDALVKRDAGTLTTTADVLVYLTDDHILHAGFAKALREIVAEPWDVIVPNRFTREAAGKTLIPLNNGEREHYCSGHAGVFRRDMVTRRPWSTYQHHRNWDLLISRYQIGRGDQFIWSPRDELSIIDIEPHNHPEL